MTELLPFLAVLLAAFGLVSLGWLALGWLLLPGVCPILAVVEAQGAGEGLEQSVKAMLWLRRTGLWWGRVVIKDCGLDQEGMALARKLGAQSGVEFSPEDCDCI